MAPERVLERFILLECIGRGGFGTVYRAWDERLEREVAVKAIPVRKGPSERIVREAQAVARLNHRAIVTLYELGEDARNAYLVSELVEGETLDEIGARGGISDRDLGRIGVELCEALEHAHTNGVIHRDVKPRNVIVRSPDAGGEVTPRRDDRAHARRASGKTLCKLMDFGIARLSDAPALTPTGQVVGTIAYMAPEQAEGDPPTAASDIYSLALTLYEGWAGQNPVAASTPAATARAIGSQLPSLARHRPDLPAGLRTAIDAAVLPNPDDRPMPCELKRGIERAIPRLDPRRALPSTEGSSPRAAARADLVTLAALAGIVALVTGLALVAGRPGAALLVGALLAPLPLLLARVTHWGAPALAPLLGAIGLAPLFPALAAIVDSPARRFALGALGWAWLAIAEALTGTSLLFGALDEAPVGWSQSAGTAASALLLGLMAPFSVLCALVWGAAAVVLGHIVGGRVIALALLGVLVRAAVVVAIHGLLGGGHGGAAAPVAFGALAAGLVALWLRVDRDGPIGPMRSSPRLVSGGPHPRRASRGLA